jgi:oligopeptide/dipeptide ABC transporter ATP-binding protein
LQESSLLAVENLTHHFPVLGGVFLRQIGKVHALTDASFSIKAGETLGVVGESGCGKSTLGRAILRLYEPDSGRIVFDGRDITHVGEGVLKGIRRNMQMIFQDPQSSLNGRQMAGEIIEEPLIIHGIGSKAERKTLVGELLHQVGLSPEASQRFPHEFSGGQRQRIGIARAIALNPQLVICDEPIAALDVSIQSQVLNLLLDLQQKRGLTYLFISHDLGVVRHVSDRIAVMYLGRIVELADADSLSDEPMHPYTQALLSAVPRPIPSRGRKRVILRGDVPSPIHPPSGCAFHTRCLFAEERCRTEIPAMREVAAASGSVHQVQCHFAGQLPSR